MPDADRDLDNNVQARPLVAIVLRLGEKISWGKILIANEIQRSASPIPVAIALF